LFLVYVIVNLILEVFDEHDAAKAFNFAAFLFVKIKSVIPASEARRESFLEKDSGQAGMT
jgi:hypothetical protein